MSMQCYEIISVFSLVFLLDVSDHLIMTKKKLGQASKIKYLILSVTYNLY